MSNLLVTGANGFLGSHIAEQLAAQGHRPRLLVRRTSSLTSLEGLDYERVEGDVRDMDSLARAVKGADVVIHSAGLTGARNAAEYFDVNAAGTERLVRASLAAGVRRFVYVSSLAAQGPSPNGLAEDPGSTEAHPLSTYGKSKLAGEAPVLAAKGSMGVAVVRPPVIYGPRDRGLLPFFRMVKFRLMPLYGDGSHRLSWIHAADAASAVIATAKAEGPSGSVYTCSDGETYSWNELVDLLASALTRRPVRIPVPRPMFALAGHAAGVGARLIRQPLPLSREKVREMEQRYWVCSNDAITADLGWQPRIKADEGVAETLAWYREHRWL